MTKTAIIAALTVAAGLSAAASAQTMTLAPGDIKFRIIADNTTIDINDPSDRTINLVLQVRYDGGNALANTLGGFAGRIQSNELLASGVLDRGLLTSPYQGTGAGGPSRRGMADPHRDLFNGGVDNNNAIFNGGAAIAGEFISAIPTLAGFSLINGSDLAIGVVGRGQGNAADDTMSVGLHDEFMEGAPTGDFARWDSVFFMTYQVTNLALRTINFDYQVRGTAAFTGTASDTMIYRGPAGYTTTSAIAGTVVEGAVIQVIPTPGSVALLGLGGALAARRRRTA